MMRRPLTDLARRILTGWLARLDRMDKKSVRADKENWLQRDFHLPPTLTGIFSALLLYAILVYSAEYTTPQAIALAVFVTILAVLFSIYLHRDQKDLVSSDDAMALLAFIFFITLIVIKAVSVYSLRYEWLTPYATPVTIAPLLTALLLSPRLAMVLAFAVGLIFGMLNGFSLGVAMVGAIGGVTVVAAVNNARAAHQVARAGLIVGLVQGLVVLFLAIFLEWDQTETAVSMGLAFLSGIVSAAFCLGVLPYLEGFFSRLSNLRLLELAAVNHPLLQRLSIEAPGTYHHSLIVASLAEDAANAIGANGLLCRVGAYFHDIGKMVKAEYFIENQSTFGNPHDQVSPSLSKLVITSHVKEGLALAKSYKIDRQVADFIPQHHGTSQIEYFYQKALKIEAKEEADDQEKVEEDAYRYPGPKPQSKEAGIVMLADSVEAAARTLEDPNHQRFKDVVNKIINKKLFDHQLNETPLTLRDLHVIAERFSTTLVSVHHARIPYPDADPRKEKKEDASF